MAARPQINPIRNQIRGQRLVDNSVLEPALGANAAGMTAVPTAIRRHVTVAVVGYVAIAKNSMIFRAPPSGATISGLKLYPGTIQNHAVNEGDTWIYKVINAANNLTLHAQTCSLSNQTIAATGCKTFPLNNGRCTLAANVGLQLQCSVSGTPASMTNCVVVVEWVPVSNA